MRLVVNTNRIIAALIKDSYSRRIITHFQADLICLNFSAQEMEKYRSELLKKSGLSSLEWDHLLNNLREKMIILNDEVIQEKMEEAKKIMDKIDPDDATFIAAALATNSDIWSDDPHFEKQNKIKIWKTKDLLPLL